MRWYRSQVGYVQQDPYGALPPFMNVQRILEEPLIINGVKKQAERQRRIEEAMTEVKMTPMEDFLPKYPHMLSGGQQQRVVIARSMILEPKLIVADEPVSMLDASVRVEILKLLRGLQESHNLAVIYITHDLSTVRYFSEYIFVMYAGQIVEKARVDDLLGNPAASLYPGPAGGVRRPGRQQRPGDARDPARRAAQPGEPARRLPLPPALRLQDRRRLRREGSAVLRYRAGAPRGLLAIRSGAGRGGGVPAGR